MKDPKKVTPKKELQWRLQVWVEVVGVRIRGTLGDVDPLNKVPFMRAISRVKMGSRLTLKYYLGGRVVLRSSGPDAQTTALGSEDSRIPSDSIWDFPKIGGGTLFWGPYNKDPTILGYGSPIFGNPHIFNSTHAAALSKELQG